MIRVLRELWLFFWRDLSIARTYRTVFFIEAIEALFGAAVFYYISRFVDSPQLEHALPQGGTYFAFSLVGFVFIDYLNAAMDSFERSLQEARDSGTLEHLLVTQTSLPTLIVGSAIYPFFSTIFRIAIYFAWGTAFFGFPLRSANWLSVLAVLLVSLFTFSSLGILSASFLLLFKRGNPGKWLLLGISSVVSGTLFPVSVLPNWLQFVAHLNPITYSLDAMRAALLGGSNIFAIWRPLVVLFFFAAVLLPASGATFAWALRRTKATGTLTHR